MVNPKTYIDNLHLHYEKPKVILERTLIAVAVIVVTSAAIFGIDTAVASITTLF